MAFRIEPSNRSEDRVDFIIVTNDNVEHNITLQKPDTVSPETVARLNECIASFEDTDTAVDRLRAQLVAMSPENKHVWDQLVQRQLVEIFNYWNSSIADEDTTLGEA